MRGSVGVNERGPWGGGEWKGSKDDDCVLVLALVLVMALALACPSHHTLVALLVHEQLLK